MGVEDNTVPVVWKYVSGFFEQVNESVVCLFKVSHFPPETVYWSSYSLEIPRLEYFLSLLSPYSALHSITHVLPPLPIPTNDFIFKGRYDQAATDNNLYQW